jgi:hypothetical protein
MQRTVNLLLSAMLAFATVGCVPFLTFTHFAPQMAGGEIRISKCLGHESVEYKIDGIRLTSSLPIRSSPGERVLALFVFFSIPVGTKVELLSREISVASPPEAASKQVLIPEFVVSRVQVKPAQKLPPTDGSEVNFRNLTATSSFYINVLLTGIPVSDLRIELPNMKINDRVMKIPPIDFKKSQRTEVFAPLNC